MERQDLPWRGRQFSSPGAKGHSDTDPGQPHPWDSTGTFPFTNPIRHFVAREVIPGATFVHAGTVLVMNVVGFLWAPEAG